MTPLTVLLETIEVGWIGGGKHDQCTQYEIAEV